MSCHTGAGVVQPPDQCPVAIQILMDRTGYPTSIPPPPYSSAASQIQYLAINNISSLLGLCVHLGSNVPSNGNHVLDLRCTTWISVFLFQFYCGPGGGRPQTGKHFTLSPGRLRMLFLAAPSFPRKSIRCRDARFALYFCN